MVEFVNYTGHYPCLCFGELTLRIDGETVTLPSGCLVSGGMVTFGSDWEEFVSRGKWGLCMDYLPVKYHCHKQEIEECVNANVTWGCCGGCV